MHVVPVSVGTASRRWDEQHLDLTAAARQIGAAATSGFTGPVSGAAARFTRSWERSTTGLAQACEDRGDSLRAAVRDYVGSDDAQGLQFLQLLAYLEERR